MLDIIPSWRARLARLLDLRPASAPLRRGRAWRIVLPAFALAGTLVLAAAQELGSGPRVSGWLLADRGAHQLLQLDRGLQVLGWQPAAEPLRVATRAPGTAREGTTAGPAAWWIEGTAGQPLGPHRLHALGLPLPTIGGATPAEPATFSPAGGEWPYLRDLVVDARGVAYVLSGTLDEAVPELWRVRQGQPPTGLGGFEGAHHLALDESGLWCGGSGGRLWRVTFAGDVLEQGQVGVDVHALEARDGELWCLGADGVLTRLSADLEPRWSVDLGFAPGPLAVDRGGVAWVAAEGQPFVQPVDPDGELLAPSTDVGGDSWTAADASGRTPLGAAPGYVLQLDEFGGAFASQGGFAYLGDLAPIFADRF